MTETQTKHYTMREPTAGDLRGVNLRTLESADPEIMIPILSRVLGASEAELNQLPASQYMQYVLEFIDFLTPREAHPKG